MPVNERVYKGDFPYYINKLKGRIIMKEKERVREMDEIRGMERAEEAKREEMLNEAESSFNRDEERYDAKINKMEDEILDEQDRVGVFKNPGSNN